MLTRALSTKEKLLLLGLAVLLLAVLYFLLIHQPVANQLVALEGEKENAELQLQLANGRLKSYNKMKKVLEANELLPVEMRTYVPDYDNEVDLLAELHWILSGMKPRLESPEVKIELSEGMALRTVHFTFTAPNYSVARQKVEALTHTRYRSLMDTVSILPAEKDAWDDSWIGYVQVPSEDQDYGGIEWGAQKVTGTITFYEHVPQDVLNSMLAESSAEGAQ